MKKIFVLFCLAVVALSVAAKEYKYDTVKGDPMQTRIYTLENGLRVYLSVNKEKPRLQANIAVNTGSRNDPAETTGLAHYLEHLMFKGTKRFGTIDAAAEQPILDEIESKYEYYRTLTDTEERKACYAQIDSLSQLAARYNVPNEYDKLMSSIGATGTNAYTSNDVTCYINEIPANELEKWMKVESDRFQNLTIRGFHTELEAVYEEYNMSLTEDSEKMWDTMFKLLWPNHPYGTQTTIGRGEHLKNPSISNIKKYYANYYCPNNVAICLAGDIEPDKTIALIDKYFGAWQRNPSCIRPEYAPAQELTAPAEETIWGQNAANITIGWSAKGANALQCDTLTLIGEILSNGKAGIYDLNINQKMKAGRAHAGVFTMKDYSMFLLMGIPKKGQTTKEVKTLMLAELENLKQGNFNESLLNAIVNNMRRYEFMQLESNSERASRMVDAFIDDIDWKDNVEQIDRIAKITKAEVVDFANRFFRNNYAVVYKEQGEDKSNKEKIDKPAITPIPANRELQSDFVKQIIAEKSAPIEPLFPDYDKDIARGKTKAGLPVMYVKNTENGLFNLVYEYDFGYETDKRLSNVSPYLSLLSTKKMNAEQIKTRFYELACDYNISVGTRSISVSLSGLAENMVEAMTLVEDVLQNAQADQDIWQKYVDRIEKSRKDARANQQQCFAALTDYARYGTMNTTLDHVAIDELRKTDPQQVLALLDMLKNTEHSVLYFGPATMDDVIKAVNKNHKIAKKLSAAQPTNKYQMQQTSQNEVYIAPYNAKNIMMRQYLNKGIVGKAENLPMVTLFNEYFGGSMNAIVFQELRETRGLAYSASANYAYPARKGQTESFSTYIVTQNDKMMDCVNTFNSIMDNFPQNEAAFSIAKTSLINSLRSKRTTKMNIIRSYIASTRLGIDKSQSEIVYNGIQNLTLNDLAKFANQHIANQQFRYIILGDETQLDLKALEDKGAKIIHLTLDDIFGE